MFCTNCGKENTNGTKFCTGCGAALHVNTEAAQTVQAAQPMPAQQPIPQAQSAQQPVLQAQPVQQPIPQAQPVQQPMPQIQPVQQQMPQPMNMPYTMGAVPPAQPQKTSGGAKAVIIILVALIFLGLGVIALLFVNMSLESKKFEDALYEAEKLSQNEKFEKAEEAYLELLEEKSDNVKAIDGLTENYIAWADSYIEEGDYASALDVLRNADSQAGRKIIKEKIAEIEDGSSVFGSGIPAARFGEYDFTFTSDENSITTEKNHSIIVYADTTYYTDSLSGESLEYYEEFTSARGLALGMSLQDYLDMYNVGEGYAVWEAFSGAENEYTTFEAYYNGQTPAELYDEYNNVWLDIGFSYENGIWRQMEDWEVQDTWFCNANLRDYDEVAIFAVNLDEWGEIVGISLEYFTYDENWVTWQDWIE